MPGAPKGTFNLRKRKFLEAHQKKHGSGYGSREQLAEEERRAEAGREIERQRQLFRSGREERPTPDRPTSKVARARSSKRRPSKAKAAK